MTKSVFLCTAFLAMVSTLEGFSEQSPLITSVNVDNVQQQLIVNGIHLTANKPTTVLFNGEMLALITTSPTKIAAKLSAIPPVGNYLLVLSTGPGSSDVATFIVTIAALQSQGSGSVRVLDANDHVLGTVVGMLTDALLQQPPNGVVIYSNGYFIGLLFSGRFPAGLGAQIYWTGSNCSGNGYLSDFNAPRAGVVMGTKVVIYSGQTNALYVPSGAGASVASILAGTVHSIENSGQLNGTYPDGSSDCSNGAFNSSTGWLLSPFNASTMLGWTLSGNPLGVPGPIKFQQ
jgi:hypothetical protein